MRTTTRTAAAAAAVVLLAAGCAAGGSGGNGGSGSRAGTLAASKRPASLGPPTITSRQAGGVARSLLARAPLPRGAKARPGAPPAALNQPSGVAMGRPSAELHKLWTVAEPMSAVYRFWQAHTPAGMLSDGSGQSGDRGVITQESTGYVLKREPAGVNAATLSMSVAPAGRDASVIRADVQVVWYPPRSAAEYIPPGTRAVTITVSAQEPRRHTMTRHSATKTITTHSVVQRLAAMLNGVYAMPGGAAFSCPLETVTFRLAFAKTAGAAPFLVATDTGCQGVAITVGGHRQPALETPAGLQKLVESLTHMSSSSGPAAGGPTAGTPAAGGPAPTEPN